MEPLISVIIPVYKVEEILHRCVDSVISQTYQNLEIILVDDASPDNCPAICDAYAEKDKRVKVIHKANAGVGEARNTGVDVATGEYLFFLDSDDFITPNAIGVLYNRICQDGSDMAIGRFTMYYEDGSTDDHPTEWMKDALFTGQELIAQMSQDLQYAPAPWGKLYKRELFREIRYPQKKCGEDLWVWPMLVNLCDRISVVDEIICYYYQRAGSIMNTYNAAARKDSLEAHLHVVNFFLQIDAHACAVKWYAIAMNGASMVLDPKEARKICRQYLDAETNKRLLRCQRPMVWLLYLSMYVPCLKKIPQWRDQLRKKK